LRAPESGEVRIGGASYAELGARKSALIRGWLPQARGDAFASTVLETALVGRHPHLDRWGWESEKDAQIVRQALAAVDLAGFEQRDVQTLSGGERQRVAIATLLAQAPRCSCSTSRSPTSTSSTRSPCSNCLPRAARETGAAVAMVLHEPALAWRYSDRVPADPRRRPGYMARPIEAPVLASSGHGH
jgi:iron complex transport system ATP-binding protein